MNSKETLKKRERAAPVMQLVSFILTATQGGAVSYDGEKSGSGANLKVSFENVLRYI